VMSLARGLLEAAALTYYRISKRTACNPVPSGQRALRMSANPPTTARPTRWGSPDRTVAWALCCTLVIGTFTAAPGAAAEHAAQRRAARLIAAAERLHRAGESLRPLAQHLVRLHRRGEGEFAVGAGFYLGHALAAAEKPERAFETWLDLEDAALGTAWELPVRVAVARGRHLTGAHDRALAMLDDLIRAHRDEPDDALAVVRAAVLAGDIHAERGARAHARRSYGWAIAHAEAVFTDPAAEGIDLAAIRAQRAAQRPPKPEPAPPSADELFARAERARAQGRWSRARERYETLIGTHPASDRVPASRWAVGVCLLGAGELRAAAEHWRAFIEEDPAGPWRGPALVWLGDLLLEHRLDVEGAGARYRRAHELFEAGAAEAPGWDRVAYALFQRLGLLAYLRGKRETALAWFERANRRGAPRLHEPGPGSGPVLSAMEALIGYLRDGNDLTPAAVRRPGDGAALLCLLGDLYGATHELDHAARVYRRVIAAVERKPGRERGEASRPLRPSPAQVSWAHRGLGHVHYVSFEFGKAQRHYAAAIAAAPRASWADDVLLRRGIVAYSCQDRPEEALAHYRRIQRDHPRSDKVEQATYFIAVLHHWEGRYDAGERYYRAFLRRYPDSMFAGPVRHNHLPELARERAEAEAAQAEEATP